jgi:hypothetical protein
MLVSTRVMVSFMPSHVYLEFLQEKLAQETSRPEFSRLPFRYAEIAHVLLDLFVPSAVNFAYT